MRSKAGRNLWVTVAALALALAPCLSRAAGYGIGADLSFLKQQEDAGRKFKDAGAAKPGLEIFRAHGYSWVRLRLFHTPTSLPNSYAYTLAMAKQAKALGFRFLLDFHYSDTWADPGAQSLPKAWASLSHAVLQDSVYRYTRETLIGFAAAGAAPDMVQIGNEINNGMLWPDGRSADFAKLADLIKAGVRGVDSASAGAMRPQVMLHIACGGDTTATKWFFDNAAGRGIDYDAIGQSYYPLWHGTPADLARNLDMMGRRYAKDIWVVETAFSPYPQGGSPFPLTDAGQSAYLRHLDSLVRATPNGRGKGWMWWEPTANEYLGTPRGLFDAQLNARPALSAFDGMTALRPGGTRPRVTGTLLPSAGSGPGPGLLRADGRQARGRNSGFVLKAF